MNRIRDFDYQDQPEHSPPELLEEVSEDLLGILWRRRWTIALVTVLALAGGLMVVQRATPQYESASRIYVELSMPRVFHDYQDGAFARSTNYLYTQAELLDSTPILSDAMHRGRFAQLQTFADVDNTMTALRKRLITAVGRKDDLIRVSFKSPYPEEAAHIVNTVVDAYITFHGQRKRNSAAELLKILRQEKVLRDGEANERLQAMMDFRQQSEGLALGTNHESNVILRSLERLSFALTEAQLATVESKSLYAITRQLQDDPGALQEFVEAERGRGAYVSMIEELSTLRTEARELGRTRDRCLRILEPGARAILALDAEMAEIQREISGLNETFADTRLTVALQRWQADQEKEEELAGRFEEARQQAIQLNGQMAQYIVLQSQYEQTRKLCDSLDDRIKELSVVEETGALNTTVLETAEPALKPSEPRKASVMALALGLGLFGGAGLALLRERRDPRLRSAREISALLDLRVLGSIPAMGGFRRKPSVRGRRVHTDPGSQEAEAFRTVRTAIFFSAPKKEVRTILVTSPAPGEGKSTTVANLGIAMAQAGQKVLVLDADFRRPMQHSIFNLHRERKGLSLVLTGKMSLGEAIEHSGVENLDVLTSGPDIPNPAEMLNASGFKRVLDRLIGKYDRILVDSPPVMAVTDALILAARCDATILVLRAETSTRGVSKQARDALASVEAEVLGIVVNDAPHKGERYGYSGSYRYHAGAGSNGNGQKKRGARNGASDTDRLVGVHHSSLERPTVDDIIRP